MAPLFSPQDTEMVNLPPASGCSRVRWGGQGHPRGERSLQLPGRGRQCLPAPLRPRQHRRIGEPQQAAPAGSGGAAPPRRAFISPVLRVGTSETAWRRAYFARTPGFTSWHRRWEPGSRPPQSPGSTPRLQPVFRRSFRSKPLRTRLNLTPLRIAPLLLPRPSPPAGPAAPAAPAAQDPADDAQGDLPRRHRRVPGAPARHRLAARQRRGRGAHQRRPDGRQCLGRARLLRSLRQGALRGREGGRRCRPVRSGPPLPFSSSFLVASRERLRREERFVRRCHRRGFCVK